MTGPHLGVDQLDFDGWVARLAARHARRLAGVARQEGLSATDALDAVQEAFFTFLALPEARRLVDAADESERLLSALVRNVARNARRRHHRSRPHLEIEEEAPLASDDPSVEELVARAEDRARLEICVAQLGESQRLVVTLRMLEELSGEEAARALGLTPGHVAVLLHRAKRALADCLCDG